MTEFAMQEQPVRATGKELSRSALRMRHLRLLESLGSLGHLGRTADALAMTQPAASRLLAEIETLVGETLFDRTSHGMRPTLFGEIMVRRARAMLVELRRAGEEVLNLRAGFGGVVSLGSVTAPAVGPVLHAVEALYAATSHIRVNVEVDTSPKLISRLREGHLDLILARTSPETEHPLLECRAVREEEVIFLVRDDHALTERSDVGLADLLDYPWTMQAAGTPLREGVEQAFRAAGVVAPSQVLSTTSVLLTLSAVKQGNFIGAVSREVAEVFEDHGGFRQLGPSPGLPRVICEPWCLIKSRERALSPAAAMLLRIFERQLFAEVGEPE